MDEYDPDKNPNSNSLFQRSQVLDVELSHFNEGQEGSVLDMATRIKRIKYNPEIASLDRMAFHALQAATVATK